MRLKDASNDSKNIVWALWTKCVSDLEIVEEKTEEPKMNFWWIEENINEENINTYQEIAPIQN